MSFGVRALCLYILYNTACHRFPANSFVLFSRSLSLSLSLSLRLSTIISLTVYTHTHIYIYTYICVCVCVLKRNSLFRILRVENISRQTNRTFLSDGRTAGCNAFCWSIQVIITRAFAPRLDVPRFG
jgi:hypothetical protein